MLYMVVPVGNDNVIASVGFDVPAGVELNDHHVKALVEYLNLSAMHAVAQKRVVTSVVREISLQEMSKSGKKEIKGSPGWKCPHCGYIIPRKKLPKKCPSCKAVLIKPEKE